MSETAEAADLPLIVGVRAAEELKVDIAWHCGTISRVDLAPDIFAFKVYAPLRGNRALFESVKVADEGNALSWADGAIDMPATAVERLADEKLPTSPPLN